MQPNPRFTLYIGVHTFLTESADSLMWLLSQTDSKTASQALIFEWDDSKVTYIERPIDLFLPTNRDRS